MEPERGIENLASMIRAVVEIWTAGRKPSDLPKMMFNCSTPPSHWVEVARIALTYRDRENLARIAKKDVDLGTLG